MENLELKESEKTPLEIFEAISLPIVRRVYAKTLGSDMIAFSPSNFKNFKEEKKYLKLKKYLKK